MLTVAGRNQLAEKGNRRHANETAAPDQRNQLIRMAKRLPAA